MPTTSHMATGVRAADIEREALIVRLGELMLKAYAAGDRQIAAQHLQAQALAIRARSPAQITRLEGERGLGEPCYFHEACQADRLRETAA